MSLIFQTSTPFDVSNPKPLPGIAPLAEKDWLHVDESFAEQVALRSELISNKKHRVIAQTSGSEDACQELCQYVDTNLKAKGGLAWDRFQDVRLTDSCCPLELLGKSVQEDICILQKDPDNPEGEHMMTAAILCFPASWLLSEKINRPLTHIHGAVDDYDPNIARRVQRLFDGIQVGRPLWRWNALWNDTADLFQPRSVNDPRPPADPATAPFLRCERQCLLRLPETGAVVFSIHTYMMRRQDALRQWRN